MGSTFVPDDLPDLVLVLAPDDTLLERSESPEGSDRWEQALGTPLAKELGRSLFETALGEALGESARAQLKAHLDSVRRGLGGAPITLSLEPPVLGPRRIDARAHRDPTTPVRLVLVLRDTTRQWGELTRLVESESRFQTMAKASRDMVTETDYQTGHFTYLSAATESVLGYAPAWLVGTAAVDLHHPRDIDGFLTDLRSGRRDEPFAVRAHRLRHADGRWIWIEATGIRFRRGDGRDRMIGVARDITGRLDAENARLELEAELHRSQRVESLGVLAGGIAHDFNNLLTPILASASIGSEVDALDRVALIERLKTIYASTRRARALTDQMLAYAGRNHVQRSAIDLSATVRDLDLLLAATASSLVTLHWQLGKELPPIEADANQVGQIVMNLVANASEAARSEGGRIEVRTSALVADRAFLDACALGEQLAPGAYVCLEVLDDGCGMDAETRERVLDPFFTTKFTGRGLGLAVVLGIVRQHGGALQIQSEAGAGCRFRVLFPVAPEGTQPAAPQATPAPPVSWSPSGSLLVVDDDASVRELTSILLRRAGFTVYEAEDGARAVEIFRERANELSGVVLDSTMPNLSGPGAFAAIREIEPSARVLLVSGYTRDRDADSLLEHGLVGFLRKPFEPEELMRAVEQLLTEETPTV